MTLTIGGLLRAVNPNIGLVENADGSYRIGIEDVNSDEILAALAAILIAVGNQGSGVYTTPTHTWPVIGNATTVVLAANANRLYALFVNNGTEPIYLYLGGNAVMNRGIRLNASGGSYEMSRKLGNLYTGAINGICASGGMTLLVTEGV